MKREEAIKWLKCINTRKFSWDEYAMQESQTEIRERCEQCVREALDMTIKALLSCNESVCCWECRYKERCSKYDIARRNNKIINFCPYGERKGGDDE